MDITNRQVDVSCKIKYHLQYTICCKNIEQAELLSIAANLWAKRNTPKKSTNKNACTYSAEVIKGLLFPQVLINWANSASCPVQPGLHTLICSTIPLQQNPCATYSPFFLSVLTLLPPFVKEFVPRHQSEQRCAFLYTRRTQSPTLSFSFIFCSLPPSITDHTFFLLLYFPNRRNCY